MTDADFNALWKSLVQRTHHPDAAPLSESERHFYCVNLLRGSVPRSGFIGYFETWGGREIADAYEGLRVLALQPVVALLERAQITVLGNRPLPSDSSRIKIFPESLTKKEYETELDLMDDSLSPIQEEFYNYDDDIYNALCDYADRHNLQPKNS